eukprot:TRINITY_DN297_c0_g1_i2.p1 TRINITY_DN297_c0_g1~~TRINITY_DN297_c0_g1_i2.p1  ORF type:complete len:267 (-),score=64.28 TRINITY_DN297_c0_g1_i2:379-1116(-)
MASRVPHSLATVQFRNRSVCNRRNTSSVKICRAALPSSDADRTLPASVEGEGSATWAASLRIFSCGLAAALAMAASSLPADAVVPSQARLPPLSRDPLRCEKAFVGNTIGQANGVADKLLDLRLCDFSNDKTNLRGKSLSAALMVDAKFDNADMQEVVMSKAYAVGASFRGTDFTNAVLDRVVFNGADLTGALFVNTVLSGSTFDGANLDGASFEDALIGYVDIQKLCRNSTLPEEARLELACKP